MNEHDDLSELPDLSDEDVELLYAICQRANQKDGPPFKVLFAAYDAEFADQQIEQQHDEVVFRYLMRIGEGTREASRRGEREDLLQRLRSLLEARGITIVGDDATNVSEVAATRLQANTKDKPQGRRVSFDDARLEETWLSERSLLLGHSSPAVARNSLLRLPPRRPKDGAMGRRAHSNSLHHDPHSFRPAQKINQHVTSPHDTLSDSGDQRNPTLMFDPSQTQLEQNADAFSATSVVRAGRQALYRWYARTIQTQQLHDQAYADAAAQDRRTLLRQSFDQVRLIFHERREEHRKDAHFARLEDRAERARKLFILTKAFTHWATSTSHQKLQIQVAQTHLLRIKYLHRWRKIASENLMKTRKVLCRKYLAIWRERVLRRRLQEEQALAHYEEKLMKRCKTQWFWQWCSRMVGGWHERWSQSRALGRLVVELDLRKRSQAQAARHYNEMAARAAFATLNRRLRQSQHDDQHAILYCKQRLATRTFVDVRAEARLGPVARIVKLQLRLNIQRKAIVIWRHQLSLSQQATLVTDKRVLQNAWTTWNDALRSMALAQRIDERVLVESLYRWVLRARLQLLERSIDGRLCASVVATWSAKTREGRSQLEYAQAVFAERQHGRRVQLGFSRLYATMRHREHAERTAAEMANATVLPKILVSWRERTSHVQKLNDWCADARFYSLTSRMLKVWKAKTAQHQATRRRDAYAVLRARIKTRLMRSCFLRLKATITAIQSMQQEAQTRGKTKTTTVAKTHFEQWYSMTGHITALNVQAGDLYRLKLLSSVLSALRVKLEEVNSLEQRESEFRLETDLGLLTSALRKVQWATFTATRKIESAEALWLRNRGLHIKQMLRHWAAQASMRRHSSLPQDLVEEQESPSLRPASRTREPLIVPSSPPLVANSTPGYMRTPSRSRRAGRFKSLPTPAPFTPLRLDYPTSVVTPRPYTTVDDAQAYQKESMVPQVTPFASKLKASGIFSAGPSALRTSLLGRSTGKSVRFAGARRFGGTGSHLKES